MRDFEFLSSPIHFLLRGDIQEGEQEGEEVNPGNEHKHSEQGSSRTRDQANAHDVGDERDCSRRAARGRRADESCRDNACTRPAPDEQWQEELNMQEPRGG